MNHIEINVHNNGGVSDADILRVVRAAINYAVKYECDRKLNTHHYWNDPEKRVELQITYK